MTKSEKCHELVPRSDVRYCSRFGHEMLPMSISESDPTRTSTFLLSEAASDILAGDRTIIPPCIDA
jgi:hypothetical protein